jgi:hypothetical protein
MKTRAIFKIIFFYYHALFRKSQSFPAFSNRQSEPYYKKHSRTDHTLFTTGLALVGFIIPLLAVAAFGQMLPEFDKNIVLETGNGMVLFGELEASGEESATLKTVYGDLTIPLNKIIRLDGDNFDEQNGITREHSVAIRTDGSVVLDYILPISSRIQKEKSTILTMGNVLQINDLHGKPLDFMARKIDDFTRCVVNMPDYRLPAVAVRILQKDAAKIEQNKLRYSYSYTPRMKQTFRLNITLPEGASIVEISPEPESRTSGAVSWNQKLRRQQQVEYVITLQLN